jgi:hypothetical protein
MESIDVVDCLETNLVSPDVVLVKDFGKTNSTLILALILPK